MRDFSKVKGTIWTGDTGKALRRRGIEALMVSVYLMTAPGSNMLGLYYQPVLYMAHETGLGIEGASKGLRGCIEEGFCAYDDATEMVFVFEMARWQVAEQLSEGDKRCIGIQRDYESLPDNPFLGPWFDRYVEAFHLRRRRDFQGGVVAAPKQGPSQAPSQAPSKPGAGAGAGAGAGNPPKPPKGASAAVGLKSWLETVKTAGEKPVPEDDPVFAYAAEVGIPTDYLRLAWLEFRHRYTQPEAKRYRDWRAVFRKAVRGNWLKLWRIDTASKDYVLTTEGLQAERAHAERRAA